MQPETASSRFAEESLFQNTHSEFTKVLDWKLGISVQDSFPRVLTSSLKVLEPLCGFGNMFSTL